MLPVEKVLNISCIWLNAAESDSLRSKQHNGGQKIRQEYTSVTTFEFSINQVLVQGTGLSSLTSNIHDSFIFLLLAKIYSPVSLNSAHFLHLDTIHISFICILILY